jgi:hypothetical protein
MSAVGSVSDACLGSPCMRLIREVGLIEASVALRSILPGRKVMRIPCPNRRRCPGHWSSAVIFVGHLVITAFVFLSFVTVVWSVSFAFSLLQSTNPMSADAIHVFGVLESVLIRVDAAACGIVLFFGITRYVLNVMKGES